MNRYLLAVACLVMVGVAHAEDVPSPQARTIILVRHGNYVADPSADPKLGPHLSPMGMAQAYLVGARLAGRPDRFDQLLVSPMTRARDTATAIAGSFPGRHFKVVDDLAECTPATRRVKVTAHEKPADMAACATRFDRLFATYFRPAPGKPQTDMMVCHGNVIRYLVTRALGVDSKAWLEMSVSNASITRIRVEADGRFKVLSVGDVGHIPPNMRTGATGDSRHSLELPSR